MPDRSYQRMLARRRDQIQAARAKRRTDISERALSHLAAELAPRERLELLSLALRASTRVMMEHVPSLVWIEDAARLLPTMDDDTATSFLKSGELFVDRYYNPVKGIVGAWYFALHARDEMAERPDETRHCVRALRQILESVSSASWAFRFPDQYALWWAGCQWRKTKEGPPPGPPTVQTDDLCFENVDKVLRAIVDWVQDKGELTDAST